MPPVISHLLFISREGTDRPTKDGDDSALHMDMTLSLLARWVHTGDQDRATISSGADGRKGMKLSLVMSHEDHYRDSDTVQIHRTHKIHNHRQHNRHTKGYI